MSDRLRRLMPVAVVACALVVVARPVSAQFVQQGPKLVGSGATGNADQGQSVALSADGNTAIVGGPRDNPRPIHVGDGAAWIWTRSGTTWTQQGSKLVGTGAAVDAAQGVSVALSADGNTAVVGGDDVTGEGGVWIWTRSGATWTQQGGRLFGVDCDTLGHSVAISADGNTVIAGAPSWADGLGAACVFVRSGGTWTQQGAHLVSSSTLLDFLGTSVAISADGNTALVAVNGGGVALVFTRSGATWSQQGDILFGSDATGTGSLGGGVAISADGNTAVIGGVFDSANRGATWVFTRSGSTWTQRGPKLVGTGATGAVPARQGASVAISGDGNTIIEGGPGDGVRAPRGFSPAPTAPGRSWDRSWLARAPSTARPARSRGLGSASRATV